MGGYGYSFPSTDAEYHVESMSDISLEIARDHRDRDLVSR